MADQDSRSGKSYTTPEVVEFVDRTHAPHDDALARAFATPDGIPAIQVGPSDGKLLQLLLKLIDAKQVVELGTLVGYSAILMARALPRDGRLWTIESEPHHAQLARDNIAAAGLADRITVLTGTAAQMLPTLVEHGPFDAVFIDADKTGYDDYAAWAIANLRKGGLVIGDNAYLFGNLMGDTDGGRVMRAFHKRVARDCDSVCVPTPDGLVVGIKR